MKPDMFLSQNNNPEAWEMSACEKSQIWINLSKIRNQKSDLL